MSATDLIQSGAEGAEGFAGDRSDGFEGCGVTESGSASDEDPGVFGDDATEVPEFVVEVGVVWRKDEAESEDFRVKFQEGTGEVFRGDGGAQVGHFPAEVCGGCGGENGAEFVVLSVGGGEDDARGASGFRVTE